MSTLVSGRDLAKAVHAKPLFSTLSLTIREGERVGLIGANGVGKSTLLRVLAGIEAPDSGAMDIRRAARVVYVAQDDPFPDDATIASALAAAAADATPDEREQERRIATLAGRLGFPDTSQRVAELSGGWRKRLTLACGLARDPDLLLLDEPTNHLDMEGILWLEAALAAARFAFVVVSHDRAFLENVTNRVIEISPAYPGGHFSAVGAYSAFLERRAEFLEGQKTAERALANKVRREIEWLKRGPKAQTSKAKARVDDADRKMSELAELRARNTAGGAAQIEFDATERRRKKLLVANNLSKRIGDRALFRDASLWLGAGVRIGLVGPNGSGKSTLIRVLMGAIEADSGDIYRAEELRTVVFQQQRETLPRDITLSRALCEDGSFVTFRGQRIHVAGWAQRFLFHTEQLETLVRDLSGGEQARVLIARLMLRPADLLILDEPTNDLDIDSLDVLEDSLTQFPGAVILVTHDRRLLAGVCSELLALDGKGGARALGDVDQWLATLRANADAPSATPEKARAKTSADAAAAPAKPRLTYKEKLELERIENDIHAAEEVLTTARRATEDQSVATDHVELHRRYETLQAAQSQVDALYRRWEELEAKRAASEA